MTSTPPPAVTAPVELPPPGGGAGSLPTPGQPKPQRKPEPARKAEPANPGGDRPAIYVACLASYNAGILHGAWVWADEGADAMRDATRAMLARSPEPGAEEWAIHDFAGFEGARVEEYASFDTVAALAEFVVERGALGGKVLEHFGHDLDDARDAFDNYCGEFESLADYAEELTDDCGPRIPDSLRHYIDYAAMGRDMEVNGDVFTVETAFDEVHVFGRH